MKQSTNSGDAGRGLRPEPWTAFLRVEREVASTQATAAFSAAGTPGWRLVIADHQTQGRASYDTAWWSMPGGSSLLLSLVVSPKGAGARTLHVMVAAVVALEEAIRALGADPQIGWPTAVIVGDRKVAGVCADVVAESLIIGIGVNCNQEAADFPDHLRAKATSLKVATGQFCDRLLLVSLFLTSFRPLFAAVLDGREAEVLDAYRARSRTLGRRVRARTGDRTVEAIAVDIDTTGCLVLASGEHIGAGVVTELTDDARDPAHHDVASHRLRRMGLPAVGVCVASATGLVGRRFLRRPTRRHRAKAGTN